MTQTVLRLTGITKRFGPLIANDAVSLELAAGEILALLGENGAGKSTLVSILFGHYAADAGSIEVFGRALAAGNPKAALAAGIGMVHQHFTLADNLSVLDNIMMGTEPLWRPFTARAAARARLLATAEQFGLSCDPDARVARLSVGERQRVEILKALYRGARILILDEPTAVLTPQESEALFAVLSRMVAQGLSIIFISHKLAEVLRVSHRVAVLRAGKLVAQAPAQGTSASQLANWMVGHEVPSVERRPATRVAEVVCELAGVHTEPARECLHEINLQLRAGEIVAIAGVSGNGQVALAEVLSGTRAITQGSLTLKQTPVITQARALRPTPAAHMVAQGVARIPEDRHHVGVIGDLPLWENAVSERLRSRWFSRGWLVRRQRARAYTQALIRRFDVRGGGLMTPARALSGGNMQKLILGRALLHPDQIATELGLPAVDQPHVPCLIVAHQPTWGLDVGAVQAIHAHLLAARDAGAAVLIISDDLDEVLALGDRIAVMHHGHLTPARATEDWTREAIGLAMAGAEVTNSGMTNAPTNAATSASRPPSTSTTTEAAR